MFIAQYTVGLRTLNEEQKLRADVNQDNKITPADYLMISEYLVGKIGSFPACQKTSPCGSYGDLNGNDYVNLRDAHIISNYLAGKTGLSPRQETRADVNGNDCLAAPGRVSFLLNLVQSKH